MTKSLEVMGVLVCAVAMLSASNRVQLGSFQEGKITSVEKQEVMEPAYSGGDNPSDAPLQSQSYAYNIGVETGCATYVAHFESPYDYLPSAFSANREVPVRVSKHTMDFDLGYREMQMRIIRHKGGKAASCSGLEK